MRYILFIFNFFCITYALFGSSVEESINKIPYHDRICIGKFFDYAVTCDQAAHTLFFQNKPICLTGVVLKERHKTFNDTLCLKGWTAFKKYKHLFPHPNFIFCEEEYSDNYLKSVDIYIINKKSLVSCLYKNRGIFKQIIGEFFSPEGFIKALEEGIHLNSLINGNEMLLGILLGFGEESSRAFAETQMNSSDNFFSNCKGTYSCVEGASPPKCTIYPVVFMGNPRSPNVQNIIRTYDSELEEIWSIYSRSKNPLKTTLEALCAE